MPIFLIATVILTSGYAALLKGVDLDTCIDLDTSNLVYEAAPLVIVGVPLVVPTVNNI